MSEVFINYRRQDAAGSAGRLDADLARRLGRDHVFRDMRIEPGVPYAEHIRELLASCRVLIALIGEEWTTVKDKHGRRRLDNPGDLVRLEIEAALARPDVEVIPVLVDGARMPEREQLPDKLKRLRDLNAHEMSDRRWDYDLEVLAKRLERVLGLTPRPRDDREERRLTPALAVTGIAAAAALPAAALADPMHDRRIELGQLGVIDPERVTSYAAERGLFWAAVGAIVFACAALLVRSGRSPIGAGLVGAAAGALGGAGGGAIFQWLRVYQEVRADFVLNSLTSALAGALLGLAFAGLRRGASRFEGALCGIGGAVLATAFNEVFTLELTGVEHNIRLIAQATLVVGLMAVVILPAWSRAPAATRELSPST